MKNILVLALFAYAGISNVFASKTDLFQIDENKIYTEFSSLNQLEEFITRNEGITRGQVVALSSAGEIDFPVSEIGNCVSLAEPPLGIPSFVWGLAGGLVGCCSGYGFWVGPAVVAGVYFLTDEDKEEAKKAAYGCMAGGAAGLVIFVFVVASWYGLTIFSL